MKRDAMERLRATVALMTLVPDKPAVSLKAQCAVMRAVRAMLRERADAAVDKTIAILTKNLGRTDIVPSVIPDMKYFSAAIRAAVLKGGKK